MPGDDTKAMTVRLSREQAEELEAVAEVDGRPIAEVVRTAIDEHVAARARDASFQARLRESIDRNRRILRRLAKR